MKCPICVMCLNHPKTITPPVHGKYVFHETKRVGDHCHREPSPATKTGGAELGKKKSGVSFRIKLADVVLKVIVLLILAGDKSHNGWYLGCCFPRESTAK